MRMEKWHPGSNRLTGSGITSEAGAAWHKTPFWRIKIIFIMLIRMERWRPAGCCRTEPGIISEAGAACTAAPFSKHRQEVHFTMPMRTERWLSEKNRSTVTGTISRTGAACIRMHSSKTERVSAMRLQMENWPSAGCSRAVHITILMKPESSILTAFLNMTTIHIVWMQMERW